nr:hypothetical protein [Tanacetum cinerariifolium]
GPRSSDEWENVATEAYGTDGPRSIDKGLTKGRMCGAVLRVTLLNKGLKVGEQFDGGAVFAVVVLLLLLLVLVVEKMVSGQMCQQRHSFTLIVVVALGNVYKVVVAVVVQMMLNLVVGDLRA